MKSRSIKRLISVLMISILLCAAFVPGALASVSAKVSVSGARVFQYPTGSAVSISVPRNMTVNIEAIAANGWTIVSNPSNKCKAYMPISMLSPAQAAVGYTTGATVVYDVNFKPWTAVSGGYALHVLGTINGYYMVRNPANGYFGYIAAGKLTANKPSSGGSSGGTTTPSTGGTKIDQMLSYAESLLGTAYGTLDCSTFVRVCLNHIGYPANDTALHQAEDNRYLLITDISQLQRGDILCFDTSGNGVVDHTALYLGNSKFIESSQKAGGVQKNDLDSTYHNFFICARRIP